MTDVVWIVPGYPWPDEPAAGIFHRTQARALARHEVRLTVACPTPWAPWPLPRLRTRWRRYADAPRHASDHGVEVVRPRYLGVPEEPRWAFPDRLIARAVWGTRESWVGARLIHGHSAITGLAAWRLARETGLPFVLTFHGSDLNIWPDRHPERLSVLQAAAREARAVITVSDRLAERVKELTGVQAVRLPLGSDHRGLALAALPRDEARRLLGLADGRVIVLFVGNLLASKGVRALADAILPRGDRLQGVFVGEGPEEGYGATDPRAGGCLEYRGARPHEEIARYMSAADVLVLPSYREGLPTVLVEAGSLALPVIASAVGGFPGLLGTDRGTLLEEISPVAIGAALDDFANNRRLAEEKAARLRMHVLDEHDVDANAGRLLDVYRASWGPEDASGPDRPKAVRAEAPERAGG